MRWQILAMAAVFCASGCGGTGVAPVSGKVTLDGKPLPNATVIFLPDSQELNPGPGSQGKTDASGHYALQLMTKEVKGAVVGRHKVSITAFEGDDVVPSSGYEPSPFRKALVPPEYNAETKLTFSVPARGSAEANFELSSQPKEAPVKSPTQ